MYVYSQARMLWHYRMRYIGCVSRLSSDLQSVLELLGYAPTGLPRFQKEHCITSCDGAEQYTDWFDSELELRVLRFFQEDFYLFNFSTLSQDMYDDCAFNTKRLRMLHVR